MKQTINNYRNPSITITDGVFVYHGYTQGATSTANAKWIILRVETISDSETHYKYAEDANGNRVNLIWDNRENYTYNF